MPRTTNDQEGATSPWLSPPTSPGSGAPRETSLENIPRDFLEAYPYPVFVVPCGMPSGTDETPSAAPAISYTPVYHTDLAPFSIAWSNAKWRRKAGDRSLLECVSTANARWLGDWLVGASSRGLTSPSHDDRSSATSLTPLRLNEDGETSLVLDFTFPSGRSTYLLSKTSLPIFRIDDSRHALDTHTFAVITAAPQAAGDMTSILPTLSSELPPLCDLSLSESRTKDLLRPFDPPVVAPNGVPDHQQVPRPKDEPVSVTELGGVDTDGRPSDVRRLMTTIDWSKTPLGPMDTWSQTLRAFVPTLMVNPTRAVMWIGREFTQLYNQSYANSIPDHPAAFGRSGPEAWAEIWSQLGPETEAVLSGQGIHWEDMFTLFQCPGSGKTYETYRNSQWIPLRDGDGEWVGIFNCNHDTTAKVLKERRGKVVRELSERTSTGGTMEDFTVGVLDTVAENPKDAPFAMLYHVEKLAARAPSRIGSRPTGDVASARVRLVYAGGVGTPYDHDSPPEPITLSLSSEDDVLVSPLNFSTEFGELSKTSSNTGTDGLASATEMMRRTVAPSSRAAQMADWPFIEALGTHRTIFVEDCRHLLKDYDVRVWDELPSSAVVIPITRDTDDGIPGAVMVLGLSCRLDFDEEYESFIHSLRIQMASYLTAVRSYCQDQELIRQLAGLDQAKNLFFSNISHELLTPLGLVAGPIDDLIAELPPHSHGRHRLQLARRSVAQLKRLVSMLMDVSSLEAGRKIGSFSKVNLGVLTQDAAGMFRKVLEKNRIEFVVDCDETPRDVYVDRDCWEKILVAVMSNAVKYTRKGHIHLSVTYDNRQAIFSVQDTSRGISQHFVEQLGEQMYQRDHNDAPAGAIIALTLVRKLVDLHGGTVEVESHMAHESTDGSHGTRVTICIPMGSSHLPPEDIINTPRTEAQEIRQVRRFEEWEDMSLDSPPTAERRSWGVDPSLLYFEPDDVILIVDDLPDSLRYMRSIFEPFCQVVTARQGEEAMEICRAKTPDLILCDVTIRNPSGDELLKMLRKGNREMQMVPFVMLTTSYDPRPDHSLHADDYLAKPFNARELLARVHMQMQLSKRRRTLEAKFDERTAEMRALTEESPIGIFRADTDGRITYCNAMWYKQSGYPTGIPIGDFISYFVEEQQEDVRQMWAEFLRNDSKTAHTNDGQWKTGVWCTFTIVKLFDPDGTFLSMIGCCMDITGRKLNEQLQRERTEQAEQRRREAEEAKAQQELLIDITSHEIRNPISSLMQCSSLVKTNLIGLQEELAQAVDKKTAFIPTRQLIQTIEEDLEALDSIYECALTQERISNDVLSLGKIQLDLLQMFDVETNIRDEAQKIVNVFQNEARMNRIDLSLTFSKAFEELGVHTIKTDPVRLGQVITNLLANAIRFVSSSDERRINVRLDVSTEPPVTGTCVKSNVPDAYVPLLGEDTPLYLYIAVADTGPGLRPSELETLFQRFTQASAKTHTVFGGSGLGLFVCRKITELMGGRIEVASEFSRGSVFRFFVQTRASHSTPQPPRRKNLSSLGGKPKNGLPSLRVLIVEDNMINRTVLQRQLKHVGLTPEAVGNGLEAVEKLRSLGDRPAYDCILMDLEMPVMDGYTATRLLRQDEALGRPPHGIIALTGNARQALLQEQMIDFDDVVVKPYRLDDLLRKVESVAKMRAVGNVGARRLTSPPTRPPPTPLTPPSRDGRAFSEPSVLLWSAVEKARLAEESEEMGSDTEGATPRAGEQDFA